MPKDKEMIMLRKLAIFTLFALLSLLSFAQDNFIDINVATKRINDLKLENEQSTIKVKGNSDRKTVLEGLITKNDARIKEINEAIAYSEKINAELGDIYIKTKDRLAQKDIEKSRTDISRVRSSLVTEKSILVNENINAEKEKDLIELDNARLNQLSELNNARITALENSVSSTQNKITEIKTKLDEINSKLAGFRQNVLTAK
jgi:hypothetical protein